MNRRYKYFAGLVPANRLDAEPTSFELPVYQPTERTAEELEAVEFRRLEAHRLIREVRDDIKLF